MKFQPKRTFRRGMFESVINFLLILLRILIGRQSIQLQGMQLQYQIPAILFQNFLSGTALNQFSA